MLTISRQGLTMLSMPQLRCMPESRSVRHTLPPLACTWAGFVDLSFWISFKADSTVFAHRCETTRDTSVEPCQQHSH